MEALAAPYTLKDTPAAGAEDVEQPRENIKSLRAEGEIELGSSKGGRLPGEPAAL